MQSAPAAVPGASVAATINLLAGLAK